MSDDTLQWLWDLAAATFILSLMWRLNWLVERVTRLERRADEGKERGE